ncbi:uncharacterized protein LOC34624268, partial [Cyclospora cayetanensis]|uniref:Uncharacterized protein LOC34624268 n=1 Tax=Cyclospora cayetanensis TaxID=88456 RepID=A0A6P6S0D7_9EIME
SRSSSTSISISLPAMPPLDLSAEGLESFLKELGSIFENPQLPPPADSLSTLLAPLAELLKAVEGMILPPAEDAEARNITSALRDIFQKQSILKEKLSALQTLATDGGLASADLESVKDIARRQWTLYEAQDNLGLRLLQQLRALLEALFPNLEQQEQQQREQQQQQ